MSVFRRLYNVAYGKVRAWQAGGDGADDLVAREIDGMRARDELREPGLRARWTPPETEADAAPASDAAVADEPRPRRL